MLAEGVYVEKDVLGIVERIMETWPNLKVKFLNPDMMGDVFDAPYVVVETLADGSEAHVLSVWTLDERVMDMIHNADILRFRNADEYLKKMDEANALAKRAEQEIEAQKSEAIREMVAGVIGSPKDTYTATNPVTEEKHEFRSIPKSPD